MPTERPIQTRSRSGSGPQALNLADMKQLVGSLCKRHAVAAHAAPTACKRTVSGSVSLPCSGCFPPFPHGTGPLSVFRKYLALRDGPRMVPADSDRIPRVPPYSGGSLVSYPCLYGGITLCAAPFRVLPVQIFRLDENSYYPDTSVNASVWATSLSIATTQDIDFSFSSSGY